MPVGHGGVSCTAVSAPVERQELRSGTGQPSRHGDLLGVHREVNDRAARKRHVARIPVVAVLSLGVVGRLARQLVLYLGRGDRQPVDEQRQVKFLGGAVLIFQLPGNGQPVGLVPLHELGSEAMCGPEVGEPDQHAVIDDAAPQHVHGATLVEFGSEPGVEGLLGGFGAAAVQHDQPVPVLGLGVTDEHRELGSVNPQPGVKERRCARLVSATLDEPAGDFLLERFLVRSHAMVSTGAKPSPP